MPLAAAECRAEAVAAVDVVADTAGELMMRNSFQVRRWALALVIAGLALLAGCDGFGARQKSFASPEEAVDALIAAVKVGETRGILQVLGEDARTLIESGDPVQDRQAGDEFVKGYETAHAIADGEDGSKILEVGRDKWPFPFPLIQDAGKWRFDSTAGADEIINRRVGDNELFAMQACLAYVDAQREYYLRNPEKDPLLHYAQRLMSSPGKRDGLYFEVAADEPQSPLGTGFANARSEGYLKDEKAKSEPFHGYYFRIVKAQGPNAAGGAYDYVVRDKMIGGFALVAFPAEYGSGGVMTFIVNHDGVVFSKDLGAETAKLASGIAVFDPDSSWKREEAI